MKNFWESATYVFGITMFLIYVTMYTLLVILIKKNTQQVMLAIKMIEFLIYFTLTAYLSAVLDFAFVSLSYMVMFSALLLIVNVVLKAYYKESDRSFCDGYYYYRDQC